MRPDLSAATLDLLNQGFFDVHWMVEVANADGTMIDLSDRLEAISGALPSPDAPIGTLQCEFLREVNDDPATSLAPLIASDLNVDDSAAYAELLQLGRRVVARAAITAVGAARPATVDFDEFFRGRISKVGWGGRFGNAKIQCNDQGGELQLVKSEAAYVYEAGTAVEAAIQEALVDDGYGSVTLNTPVATGVVLGASYGPPVQTPLWGKVQALASSIGRLCWWRYQADGAADLTLFTPDRNKATSDFTFPRIMEVNRLDVDEGELASVLYGIYSDEDGVRQTVGPVEDAASIQKYGGVRRAAWIVEAADSVVRTSVVMSDLLTYASSDVSDHDAIATYKVPLFLWGECGVDRYTFPADDIHYDSPQLLAPFAIRFSARSGQEAYSEIDVRGRPSGGSGMWRARRQNTPPTEAADLFDIQAVDLVASTDTTRTFRVKMGAAVELGDVHWYAFASPLPATYLTTLYSADNQHLSVTTDGETFVVPVPAADQILQGVVIPRKRNASGNYEVCGQAREFQVDVEYATPAELAVVEQAAADAVLAAAGAEAAVDGKITTFLQATTPTAEAIGDLWIDTDDGNKLYRASAPGTGSWVEVQDDAIAQAIAAAATAQETADGKIVSFFQASQPVAEGIGDLWTDTDANNHLYRWNGSSWVSMRDGTIAIAQNTANTALANAATALSAANDAQATADGKIQTFYQASAPTAEGVGDLWIDTDDDRRLYRWSGSAWVAADDGRIAQAITDAAGAQATADGKVTTFYQASAPTAEAVGDLWVDTDDDNHPYRWSGSAWVSIRDGSIADAQAAAQAYADALISPLGAIILSAAAPTVRPDGSALRAGDMWVETDNGNKPWAWNGIAWSEAYTAINGDHIITGTIQAGVVFAGTLLAVDGTFEGTVEAAAIVASGSFTADLMSVDGEIHLTRGNSATNADAATIRWGPGVPGNDIRLVPNTGSWSGSNPELYVEYETIGGVWTRLVEIDSNPSASQTALSVRANIGGSGTLRTIEIGAADSGGVGYRALRIAN